nr:DUF4118 domain-containing protein [uncultured Sellimonas sp.]
MEKMKQQPNKLAVTCVVMILATVLSVSLYTIGIRAENILMIYTFGIIVIIIETKTYSYGIVASFVTVAIFNYLFTEPRFTFRMYDKNYIISFVIFLVVSMIVSSLTIQLQKKVDALEQTQKITDILYQISSGYLHVSGLKQVATYGLECLNNIKEREYILFVNDAKNNVRVPYKNSMDQPKRDGLPYDLLKASEWCFLQSQICGTGTEDYGNLGYYLIPIVSKGVTYGVLAINTDKKPLDNEDKKVMEAVVSIIAVAMDREFAEKSEQETRFITEREKLRNNLLRSISHDLRTPLAGITGSTSFLLESHEQIGKENMETLLRDIMNDSIWLGQLVDNLLNMTRIQEGKLNLRYNMEIVDDIISEVSIRVQRRLGNRELTFSTPDNYLAVPMDGRLIIQVLVNLVDNAVKHTPENGHIKIVVEQVSVKKKNNERYAKFSVIDDGTGIDEKIQKHMFESFVTTDHNGADTGRGIGLGLSIASEIIQVHDGMIGSKNNETMGATVYFLLPLKRRDEDE